MLKMILPVLLIVASNTFYHTFAKFTPARANTFLSLTVTYITAAVLSFIAYLAFGNSKGIAAEGANLNWTSLALGVAIIGLEFGYIWLYRTGWKISVGSLASNIALACVLLLVGILVFRESISIRQIIGMIICALGLVLITK